MGITAAQPACTGRQGLLVGIGRRSSLGGLANADILVVDDLAAVNLAAIHLAGVDPIERIRLHRDMVAACCRRSAFLPARLEIRQRSPRALRAFLVANRDRLNLALDRVDGYVEISVEVTGADLSSTDAALDTLCLRDRLEHIADAVRIEAGLRDSQSRATLSDSATPTLKMALLAPSVAAFTIADRLERGLKQFASDYRTQVSGPWPPYSFSALS